MCRITLNPGRSVAFDGNQNAASIRTVVRTSGVDNLLHGAMIITSKKNGRLVAAHCKNAKRRQLLGFDLPHAMRPEHWIAADRIFQDQPARYYRNGNRSGRSLQVRERQSIAVALEEHGSGPRIHG